MLVGRKILTHYLYCRGLERLILHAQPSTLKCFSSTVIADGKSGLMRTNSLSEQAKGTRKRGQKSCRGLFSSCRGAGQGKPQLSCGAGCFPGCSTYILLQKLNTLWLVAKPWRRSQLVVFSLELLKRLNSLFTVIR